MCTEQEDCDRVIRVLKSDWGSNAKRKIIVDEKRFEGESACSVTKEKRRKKKEKRARHMKLAVVKGKGENSGVWA